MARQRRIAQRYRRTTRSDPAQLTRGSRRLIQRAALADSRGRGRNAVSISFSVNIFSDAQLTAISDDRQLRAEWNRAVRNLGALLQRKARQLSRPTYDTGLFSSSWDAVLVGSGLKLGIRLVNTVYYAGWVRRSGQRQTVVDRHIRPMVGEEVARWARDVVGDGPLLRLFKRRLLAAMAEGLQ
jgi:hypothetical protein